MRKCIIGGKKYSVFKGFNMVANYHFKDKHGKEFLVDGQDVSEWINSGDATPEGITAETNLETAIAYARYLSKRTEDGVFWRREVV